MRLKHIIPKVRPFELLKGLLVGWLYCMNYSQRNPKLQLSVLTDWYKQAYKIPKKKKWGLWSGFFWNSLNYRAMLILQDDNAYLVAVRLTLINWLKIPHTKRFLKIKSLRWDNDRSKKTPKKTANKKRQNKFNH